ncbi:unnamed protein product [Lepidochelys kempii]
MAAAPALIAAKGLGKFEQSLALLEGRAQHFALRGGSSQGRSPSWQGEGTAGGKLTEERSQLARGGHRWGEAHRGGVPAGKGRAPLGGSSQRRGPSWQGEGTAGGKLTEERSQLARGGHCWGEVRRGGSWHCSFQCWQKLISARAPTVPQKLERHLLEPPVSMCTALLRGR